MGRKVTIGPSAERLVRRAEFSKLTRSQLEQAWEIIAPSITRNIDRLPMWEVIAAAYLEGCNHGYYFAQEEHNGQGNDSEAS